MSGGWRARWDAVFADDSEAGRRRWQQARTLHRSGRVTDVRVRGGLLTGRVQGSRATPFLVEIAVPELDDAAWAQIERVLVARSGHGARLLAGRPPEGLEDELVADGIALFPVRGQLELTSPCRESQPCPHTLAVWHAAGERLDDDPFVLLRLRGRGRQRLLRDLAAARRPAPASTSRPGTAVADLDPAAWHRAATPPAGLDIDAPQRPRTPAAPLRVLGDPPGWPGGVSAWDLLRPLIEAAGDYAVATARR